LVASLGEIPDDERQVHFEVPLNPSDADINAMLDLLAEDSSDAVPAGTLAVVPLPEVDTTLDVQKPVSTRPRRPSRTNQPGPSADEQKKKRRRLRRVSSFDEDAGISVPAAEEVPATGLTDADPNGCTQTATDPNVGASPVADPNGGAACVVDPNGGAACVVNVDDEEEENEVPLTRKNSRQFITSGESSGVPSPALSALIGLQELSLANFDQALEDMVPEDLLSEPVDDGAMEACADVPDAGLRSSRASSTLERDLEGRETGLNRPGPMEVEEGPSTLEVVTAESLDLKSGAVTCPAPEGVAGDDLARVKSVSHCPAPEGAAGDDPAQMGSANYDPAPEDARAGSPSCTSMDVHAGSPPRSGCMVVVQNLDQEVALEGSAPAGRVLGSVEGTELISADLLRTAPGGGLPSAYQLISPDLGIPSFFSNLQVLCCILT
jgi:hypothetical protein